MFSCGCSPWLCHAGTWGSSGTPRTFTERKQSFVYDTQGHLTARNTEQAVNVGSQTGTRRYSHRYVWDNRWGRLLGEAWPNGVGRGYVYDGVGRVVQENGLGDGMPAVLREVKKIDVRGQTIEAGLGDCVLGLCITQERSYAPSTGQMLTQSYRIGDNKLHSERYRHDYLANLTQRERLNRNNNLVGYERYTYDELQRMTWSGVYSGSSTSSGSLASSVNLTYDAVGNLTRKSDYANTYSYPGGATQPNAPTSTSGVPTGTTYYQYDASGNLIARSPNDSAPIATNNKTFQALYNHNHQVIFSATRPAVGTTAWEASSQYFYDAQNRLSRQVEGAGSAAEHLIYLEGYEDRVGGYRTRSYVDDYAHITRYRYGQLELRFLLTDRLGSVVGVVRVDRDSGGGVRALEPEVELAYDVFGAPRHASDWSPLVGAESWPQARSPWDVTPTTRHGFTGHEMLSKQRLIHMRGRLFDPRMGRFTGVDPVIQFPLSTQGLNPYSYLLNNPLAGTDPTGYCADAVIDGDKVTCSITPTGSHIALTVEGTIGTNGRVTFSGSVNTVGGDVLVGSSTLMSAKVMSNGAMSTTQIDRGTSEVKKTDRILSVASRDNAGKATLHTSEEQVDVSSEEDLGVMWEHGLDESQREALRWGRTSSGRLEDVTFVEETMLGGAAVKSIARFAEWTWGLYKLRGAAKGAGAAEKGGLNLFKWGKDTTTKPGGWKEGDFMLHLPDQGSVKANWAQNAGRLREQMRQGNPIYDSYRDALTGQQIPTQGFLRAERNLLESRGWQYNPSTGAYHPPGQ